MKAFLSLAAPLALAATTCAQASVFLSALSPVGVMSTVGGPTTFTNIGVNFPANGLALSTFGTGNAGTNLLTSLNAQPGHASARVDSTVSFPPGTAPSAAGTTPSPAAAVPALGAVELLATFQAPAGTPARLTLRISNPVQVPPGATVVNRASLDVGADNIVELATPNGVIDVPLTIPAAGQLVVKFTLENHVTGSGLAVSQTHLEALLTLNPPALCHFLAMGSSCGGTVSGATQVTTGGTRTIALVAAGCFPNMPVVSSFGTINGGPMLPAGCQLSNNAEVLVPVVADAAGVAVHTFTVPVNAFGMMFHNFVPVDLATMSFRSSNGIGIFLVL